MVQTQDIFCQHTQQCSIYNYECMRGLELNKTEFITITLFASHKVSTSIWEVTWFMQPNYETNIFQSIIAEENLNSLFFSL